jgi:ubiquitin carboxyl-terminal hydrolase 9/24
MKLGVVLQISSLFCKKLIYDYMQCLYLFADRDEPLVEWDYLPPVGPRPLKGFVGLKNAGATCYMNSVLQQLYMVESIRVGILASEGAATDLSEDFSGEERLDGEVSVTSTLQ